MVHLAQYCQHLLVVTPVFQTNCSLSGDARDWLYYPIKVRGQNIGRKEHQAHGNWNYSFILLFKEYNLNLSVLFCSRAFGTPIWLPLQVWVSVKISNPLPGRSCLQFHRALCCTSMPWNLCWTSLWFFFKLRNCIFALYSFSICSCLCVLLLKLNFNKMKKNSRTLPIEWGLEARKRRCCPNVWRWGEVL